MFEVEKKIILSNDQVKKLKAIAKYIKKSKIEDAYYDDNNYSLTIANKWLRKRDNVFELKMGPKINQSVNHYKEITDVKEIINELSLPINQDLDSSLINNKIFPFCSFITYREKYQLGEFIIDFDIADFSDFTYQIAEFELIVPKKELMKEAEEKIENKLMELNLYSNEPVTAKLSYYLMKKRKSHYDALVKANVINTQ